MVRAPRLRPDPALARREAAPASEGPRHARFGWAGLAAGACAFAASTQGVLSFAQTACVAGTRWPALVSAGAALATLAGMGVSVMVARRAGGLARFRRPGDGRPGLFVALLGSTVGLIFLIGILSQAAATLFLTGCER